MRYLPKIRDCGQQNVGFGAWERGSPPLSQGFLATRNPMLLSVLPGELMERYEERTKSVLKRHEPPRSTRCEPDTGPSGFVDGLTE